MVLAHFTMLTFIEIMINILRSTTYFKILLSDDKNAISNSAFGINGYYIGQWTQSLSIMRNICAHFGYLYRRSYSIALDGGSIFKWVNNQNNTLFSILQVSRRLSNPINWNLFLEQLIERSEKMQGFIFL